MSNKNYWEDAEKTVSDVSAELRNGFDLLNEIEEDIVTFFGSAQIKDTEEFYKHCKESAFKLGKAGYAIITGGGPGIMHAANTGASEAGATSVGIRAGLIDGQLVTDDIYTHKIDMEFVFLRRFIMYTKSAAWVFYPGGIGTLDELSECMQLKYTGIRSKKPIICVNKEYWKDIFHWLEQKAFKNKFLMHGEEDLGLVQFAETSDEVFELVKQQGWHPR